MALCSLSSGGGSVALERRGPPLDEGAHPFLLVPRIEQQFERAAFEQQAADYLVKPLSLSRLASAVSRSVSTW